MENYFTNFFNFCNQVDGTGKGRCRNEQCPSGNVRRRKQFEIKFKDDGFSQMPSHDVTQNRLFHKITVCGL